ncbi:MAG: hypothetical protein HZA93_24180 [Verrucomicrobia bacterium]|nr:hypothetical protein [Verrucomicrobiota bacterium]
MKTLFKTFILAGLVQAASLTLAALASAQTVAPDVGHAAAQATLDTAAAVATPFIVTFAQNHPWLVSVLVVIASLRVVFKPIVSVAEAYVRSTPTPDDDAMLEKVEHSRAFKIVAWLIDYLGSIKIGPQLRPPAPTKE